MLERLTRKTISREETETLVSEFRSHILRYCQPQRLVLFGSAACGLMTDGSDLDFALIFANDDDCKEGRTNLLSQPPPQPWPVDYLFYSEANFTEGLARGGVCELIQREGQTLFEKKP